MSKKAVFFDIDGTLMTGKGFIPDSTRDSIRMLQERGNLAFICTGRTKINIPSQVINLGFDGIISGCGTLIEHDDNTLFYYELSEELAKQEINVDSNFDKFKIYCVSYMLCKRYNIDVSNYKFDNIPMELQNLTAKEIREKLEPMKNAMQNISTKVDIGVQKIMRENKK